jgi:hypothetical protein
MTLRPEVRCLVDQRYRAWTWFSVTKVMKSVLACDPVSHVFLQGPTVSQWVPEDMITIGSWFDNRKLKQQ